MSLRDARFWAMLTAIVVLITGCQPSRPFYFFEDGDLSHYKGVATEVEYPDVNTDTIPDVSGSLPPLTLQNPEPKEFWPLRLEEAVRVTLENSKVFRTLGGQVQNPTFQVSLSPLNAQTVYAPAITESDPRFGVEGTLSNFDTQWSTSVFWQKNDHPVNTNFAGVLANVLQEDAAQFQTQLAKVTAAGDRVYFRNNTNYDMNNNPTNFFPAYWTTNFEAEFRHPVLARRRYAVQPYCRPERYSRRRRLHEHPWRLQRRGHRPHERRYRDRRLRRSYSRRRQRYRVGVLGVVLPYRNLDALVVGRDSALSTWRKVKALYDAGARGGEAEKEAQAREQYFLFRGQVEAAVSKVYETENRLALPDGHQCRPTAD